MANILDINLDQGTDLVRLIKIKDASGALVDLTGRTYFGTAKDTYLNYKIKIDFTLTVKNQTTNEGEISLLIPKEQTSSLKLSQPIKIPYDIKETANDVETTLFSGYLNIIPRNSL